MAFHYHVRINTIASGMYRMRTRGENTQHLGIDRSYEIAALQAAAAADIGPEVVAFLEPQGHLVTRWVDGRHWEATEFRTPEHVRLLTETVMRIHALPPSEGVFSPFQRVGVGTTRSTASRGDTCSRRVQLHEVCRIPV